MNPTSMISKSTLNSNAISGSVDEAESGLIVKNKKSSSEQKSSFFAFTLKWVFSTTLFLVVAFSSSFANNTPEENVSPFACNQILHNVDFVADQGSLIINDCGVAEDDYDNYFGGASPPLENLVEITSTSMLFVDVEGTNCLSGNTEGDNSSSYQTVSIPVPTACLVQFEAGFSFIDISDFASSIPDIADLECQPGTGQDYLQFLYSVDNGSSFLPFDPTIASAIEFPSTTGCQTGASSGSGFGFTLSSGIVSVPAAGNVIFRVDFGSQSVSEGIQIDFLRIFDRTPTIDPISNTTICQGDSYTLPVITGSCLTGKRITLYRAKWYRKFPYSRLICYACYYHHLLCL